MISLSESSIWLCECPTSCRCSVYSLYWVFVLFIIGIVIGFIFGYAIGKWKQRFDDDTIKYFKNVKKQDLLMNKKTR